MSTLANETTVPANRTVDSFDVLLHLSIWSLRIVCPVFLIIGPICNWACIRTFQSRIYARSSSKWYFVFIAIFDTIYVTVTAPLLFLITLEIYILNWNVVFCKSVVFLNYLSCQISAGLLACLSIDRLFATSCISVYRRNCTTKFSQMLCYVVIVVFSVVNSHYLIGYNIDSNNYCTIGRYKWYAENYSRLNVVYLLSYSIIPFTIITICNVMIVVSVGQNKANMKKKYNVSKPIMSTSMHQELSSTSRNSIVACDRSPTVPKYSAASSDNHSESKHDPLASTNGEKTTRTPTESNVTERTHQMSAMSDKAFFGSQQLADSSDVSTSLLEQKPLTLPTPRERSTSGHLVVSHSSSQKMCVQRQITISLLAVSICFILCTLPNCVTTIMIQAHKTDERRRRLWQAMNFLSIIPLLITHSVNLVFYYLSSKMFRERFRDCYLKKRLP